MNQSPHNNDQPLTEAYWPADRLPADPMVSADLTVGALLRRAGGEYCNRVALVEGAPDPADRRRWTYSELLADSELTARALARRFSPGEHIAVWAPNVPEWLLLEFGAALAGLVLVTVNPALKPDEVGYVLRRSNAVGLFLLREFRGNPMAQTADQLRGELPDLREVVELDRWEDFVAGVDPASELPPWIHTNPPRSSSRRARPVSPRGPCSPTGASSAMHDSSLSASRCNRSTRCG